MRSTYGKITYAYRTYFIGKIAYIIVRTEHLVIATPTETTLRIMVAKGQNPLHQFPRNKSVTSWQLPLLRGSYGETCVMDFRHKGKSDLLNLR